MICRHRKKFEYLIFCRAFEALLHIFRYVLSNFASLLAEAFSISKEKHQLFCPLFQTVSKTPMMLRIIYKQLYK